MTSVPTFISIWETTLRIKLGREELATVACVAIFDAQRTENVSVRLALLTLGVNIRAPSRKTLLSSPVQALLAIRIGANAAIEFISAKPLLEG